MELKTKHDVGDGDGDYDDEDDGADEHHDDQLFACGQLRDEHTNHPPDGTRAGQVTRSLKQKNPNGFEPSPTIAIAPLSSVATTICHRHPRDALASQSPYMSPVKPMRALARLVELYYINKVCICHSLGDSVLFRQPNELHMKLCCGRLECSPRAVVEIQLSGKPAKVGTSELVGSQGSIVKT